MRNTRETWIFVVDNGKGKLFRAAPVPRGRFHLEEDGTIANSWEEHEHGRPSPRVGKEGNSYASRGHEDEEKLKRFARKVAGWLEVKTKERKIDHVALFAPPRFLGALRQACSPKLTAMVSEHEGDLGYMTPGELVNHRTVARLLKSGPPKPPLQ